MTILLWQVLPTPFHRGLPGGDRGGALQVGLAG